MFNRARYSDVNTQDWQKLENPAASVKHDGASFFLTIDAEGKPRYFSRRPSVKGGFPERTQQLPHLADAKLPQLAGNVYNVELVHTGHATFGKDDHPTLSGILNSLPEKSIETQKQLGPVRAILLDVISPKLSTYADKLKHMEEVGKVFGKPDILKPVHVKIGTDAIRGLIESTKKSGQEGVIITSLTKPESENTRIKVKHTNTYNLKVIRVNQEFDVAGNPKNSMGSVTVVDSTGREVADVGTGFNKEQRQEIWKNPEAWVGKEIQVKARTPHRNRLISPVFNGDSDGQIDMIKAASSIEDQLLGTLVSQYQAKGINLQKILDNPLFQQLPLAKKIAFIEQANTPLLNKPSLNLKSVAGGVVGGGIAGAISLALHNVIANPGASAGLPSLLVAAGSGAVLGGLAGAMRATQDKARDSSTFNNVSKGGLSTLVNRSGVTNQGSPLLGKTRYLGQMEGFIDSRLGPIAYHIGHMEG